MERSELKVIVNRPTYCVVVVCNFTSTKTKSSCLRIAGIWEGVKSKSKILCQFCTH